jgi:hypothetical protein
MSLQRNTEDIHPVYDLAAGLIPIVLETDQVDCHAFVDESFGRSTWSRIRRIIGKQEDGCTFAPEAPPFVGGGIFPVRNV